MRKSIKKRFKITKTGKILRRRSGVNHYLAKKPGQSKRTKRKMIPLASGEFKRIKKLISR
jgi:large subunit ribosomal protein L35